MLADDALYLNPAAEVALLAEYQLRIVVCSATSMVASLGVS